MTDLWNLMKTTWKPDTYDEWKNILDQVDILSKRYDDDPMLMAMCKAYVDEMERQKKEVK